MAATRFASRSFATETVQTLGQALKTQFPEASGNEIKRLIESGKVTVDGERVVQAHHKLGPNQAVKLEMATPRLRAGAIEDDRSGLLVYVDRDLVVVRKPAGISSVAHEDEPTSCEQVVHRLLADREGKKLPPLGVVHRLDKVTSGLMMFARTQSAKRDLKDQLRAKSTSRLYLAVTNGQVRDQKIAFRLTRDRGDGLRGVTTDREQGRFSVTHVRVVERFADCCLVQCRLETGRTHQIRIHLAEIGHPIVGEPLYTKGMAMPLVSFSRTLLHAETLGFDHPRHRGRMEFSEPPADEFAAFLRSRRARKP